MKLFRGLIYTFILLFSAVITVHGQSEQLIMARKHVQDKQFIAAIATYDSLFAQAPYDKSLYQEYLQVVLDAGKYEKANLIIQNMEQIRRDDPTIQIDKGRVWLAQKQPKKATPLFEQILLSINSDNYRTRQIADAFSRYGLSEWAIKTYEVGLEKSGYFESFYNELLLLYAAGNQKDKAVKMVLSLLQKGSNNSDEMRKQLLELVQSDPAMLTLLHKEIDKHLKSQPDNMNLQILKVWLNNELGNYAKAVSELIALDKQYGAEGKQAIGLAYSLENKGLYKEAMPVYQYIVGLGEKNYFYNEAVWRLLNTAFKSLDVHSSKEEKQQLLSRYEAQLNNEQLKYNTTFLSQYSDLLVMVDKDYKKGIVYLENAIKNANDIPFLQTELKFKLADYYIYNNQIWDAVLLYSQIDKDYKEDAVGEQARYRNARLTYFIGDFEWAQAQLSGLKSATSELIANDALNLSVLITENTTPEDTINTLLKTYAKADFCNYIHEYDESDSILDIMFDVHKEEPIVDDIFMLKSKNALARNDVQKAVVYLKEIVEKYNDDVLADDATYQLATIHRDILKDNAQSKYYFEQLILNFPNSTFVHDARGAILSL